MSANQSEITKALREWVIIDRRSPNAFLASFFRDNPNLLASDVILSLQESVLALEEVYAELVENEWNDWMRVDFLLRKTHGKDFKKGGSVGLLVLKSEMYRCIALSAFDLLTWTAENKRPMFCCDLTDIWESRGSDYFRPVL